MGQKVHPFGFRLGYNKTWRSRWFAKKEYANLLHEDIRIRRQIKQRFQHAGVSDVEIERGGNNKVRVIIHTARPGIVIGKKGQELERLRADLQKDWKREFAVGIHEVDKPELTAQLIAENIALQLKMRVAFRRAMRKSVETAHKFGARGIKVRCSGRLNGAEIARAEWYLQGRLPLHTLKADIDYGFDEAFTTYGQIGVKVWVYRTDVMKKPFKAAAEA
ncbi:MAG: 30S ribosomal protein S3 [Acidobacteria bacterium]|nr:30S ribosomal protein S3 [Acidobacteriota bacterium]